MTASTDIDVDRPRFPLDAMLEGALAQAPFAVVLFGAEPPYTVLWRNTAHGVMSHSADRDVEGLALEEAFPPTGETGGAAALDAMFAAFARLRDGGAAEEIGPYRFDLPDAAGTYVEHHWTMQLSAVEQDGRIVAVMQVAQDVTAAVLADRMAQTLSRAAESTAALSSFRFDPETGRFPRSPGVDAMFGFAPGEIGDEAAPFFDRVHPDDVASVHAEVARVFAAPRGEIACFDYRIGLPDGRERFIRIRAEVATDPEDRREKLVGTFIDLTDVEETRRALLRENAFRETLVEEANHRIKNSLAIALSMIRLESRALGKRAEVGLAEAREALAKIEIRVRAISSVHSLMRMANGQTVISLTALLGEIVGHTRESAGVGEDDLKLDPPASDIPLGSDRAVTLCLILNEVLTNALKFGVFTDGGTDIRLVATTAPEEVKIVVSNAIATERRITASPSTGLGTRLVHQMAAQIDALISAETQGGTYVTTITIPVPTSS